MGLAQKRILEDLKTNVMPKWKQDLDKAAGFPLQLEIKWETIIDDTRDNKDQYIESMLSVYISPLEKLLKNICTDDMGKNALKENLKSVLIIGTQDYSPGASTFEKGTLTLNHHPFTNTGSSDSNERAEAWRKMVEAKL